QHGGAGHIVSHRQAMSLPRQWRCYSTTMRCDGASKRSCSSDKSPGYLRARQDQVVACTYTPSRTPIALTPHVAERTFQRSRTQRENILFRGLGFTSDHIANTTNAKSEITEAGPGVNGCKRNRISPL